MQRSRRTLTALFKAKVVLEASKDEQTLAEGVGFEPTKSLRPCRFSRPVPSTARSPLQRGKSHSERIPEAFHSIHKAA